MTPSTLFHRFALPEKAHKTRWLFIHEWLAPILAWIALLAVSASVVIALLGER